MSEFELKLMDIESEHLGIPDTEYKCTVKLPAAEFQRIIRGEGSRPTPILDAYNTDKK